VKLIDVEKRTTTDHVRLVGRVAPRPHGHAVVPWAINEREFANTPDGSGEIYFEFPRHYENFVSESADPFAIALLLPSMAAGEPLEIGPRISSSLLFQLAFIRDVWNTWYPKFHKTKIVATARDEPPPPRAPRAATFFSGGVDSFYTLLKRRDHDPLPVALSHLIFMHGVERSLEDSQGVESSQRRVEQLARAAGVETIVGKTNLRTVFPLHWEKYYFGSVLAATAVALSKGLGYVCIPSSFTYHHQVPHGSTPLLDDRFSTESVQIVHDGGEASRATKTQRIVEWDAPLVLSNLRVCIHNNGGDFNCGKCYKCVRTAIALKAIGVWDSAATFPDKSTDHWRRTVLADHPVLTFENLELARKSGLDDELVRQLERIVRRVNRYDAIAAYSRNSPLERLLPIYRRAREITGGSPRMH
jgi:hypothetical protein